jgi:hypothetical protein
MNRCLYVPKTFNVLVFQRSADSSCVEIKRGWEVRGDAERMVGEKIRMSDERK